MFADVMPTGASQPSASFLHRRRLVPDLGPRSSGILGGTHACGRWSVIQRAKNDIGETVCDDVDRGEVVAQFPLALCTRTH